MTNIEPYDALAVMFISSNSIHKNHKKLFTIHVH